MLHALLHNKLDETTPEPQRLEDALTSTVFGVIALVGAWRELARWLAVPIDTAVCEVQGDCWFWPRMAGAIPDVVLRLNDFLVIIEAKYRSGRNDLAVPDEPEEQAGDQIVRQYWAVRTSINHRFRYAEPIERAIAECKLIQVFVVDGRSRRARDEWKQSKHGLPESAVLQLITWQQLFRVLNDPRLSAQRWARDLRTYLESRQLDSFDGIGRHMASVSSVMPVKYWQSQRLVARLTESLRPFFTGTPSHVLFGWRAPTNRAKVRPLDFKSIHDFPSGKQIQSIFAWHSFEPHPRRKRE
jgi:hypothetical protein